MISSSKSPYSLRVILVRPRNPLNIGAAARAMANFGVTDLAVVKPYEPIWKSTVSAVGAEPLVKKALKCSSLNEAVADRHMILGTTAVRARRVDKPLVRLPDLSAFLEKRADPSGKILNVALLFGSEKTGLSNKYLDRCHAWLTIPTHPQTPSMNLSHAVAACCYELSRGREDFGSAETTTDSLLAASEQLERLTSHAAQLFAAAHYLDFLPPEEKSKKIRRAFLQWRIHRRDAALIHGIFRFLLKKIQGRKEK